MSHHVGFDFKWDNLSLNTWTHIAQTFSATNGNRRYIGGVLVTTMCVPTNTPVDSYAFIGVSPTGTSRCNGASIVTGQLYSSIDEFHVFTHELAAIDICRLANS